MPIACGPIAQIARRIDMSTSVNEAYEDTYYGNLLELDADGQDFHLAPDLLESLGPERAVVLTLVLEAEFNAVWDKCRDSEGAFEISLKGISESSGLSVKKVVRVLEQLSDLPARERSRTRYGAIHVIGQGPEEWRVSMGPGFTAWELSDCG
jgi:hypothetical protein